MNTRGLKEIQKALKQQYYEKTGEKADRCKVYYNNGIVWSVRENKKNNKK